MAVKSLAQSSLRTASSTNSMLAGYEGNQFHHLETIRLGGNAALVQFTNLARYADYQHLQIRYAARSTHTSADSAFYVQFNGDTASNYRHHYLTGTGSSVVSGDATSSYPSGVYVGFGVTAANSAANNFGGGVVDILDPFVTTKNTTARYLAGSTDLNRIAIGSGVWLNTAALTSLVIDDIFGNLVSGSRFSLYGLKAGA
jgi:hypothetical protein